MALELIKDSWTSKVLEVTLGATEEQGGTRNTTYTIGGESCMPFLHSEGEIPHRPLVAAEVWDVVPEDWPAPLMEAISEVSGDPVKWAQTAVEEWGADMVFLRLRSTHPEAGGASAQEAAETAKRVAQAVGVPLGILGSGDSEVDNLVLPEISEALRGENCLLGVVTEDNYKTITASVVVNGHRLICQSPIDVNICKQLNILVNEVGLNLDRIVIDPTTGGLGYGIEYTYSIMERARLGALSGDRMLAMPIINFVGQEAWRAKETKETETDFPEWGDHNTRALLWEILTATTFLQAGSDLLVLRHPEALKPVKKQIDLLMEKEDA